MRLVASLFAVTCASVLSAADPGAPETWDAAHLRPLAGNAALVRVWPEQDDRWFHRLDIEVELRAEVDSFLRATAPNWTWLSDLKRARKVLIAELLPARDALVELARKPDLTIAFPKQGPTTPNPFVEPLGAGRTLSLVGLHQAAEGDLAGSIETWWAMAELGRRTMALGHGQAACISGNGLLVNAVKGLETVLMNLRLDAAALADPRIREVLTDDGGAGVAASWAGEYVSILLPQVAWVERRTGFYVAQGASEMLAAQQAFDELTHLLDAGDVPGLAKPEDADAKVSAALAAAVAKAGVSSLDIAATTKALGESVVLAQQLVQGAEFPVSALADRVGRKLKTRVGAVYTLLETLVDNPAIVDDPAKLAEAITPIAANCGNLVGDQLHDYLLPDIRATDGGARRTRAAQRLLRTAIAVRRYDLAHKGRPATLDLLVQDKLLEAVPTDPWDGKPLRYDAAAGKLWCVGVDLTDHQGDGTGAHSGRPDQVMVIPRDPTMPPGMPPGMMMPGGRPPGMMPPGMMPPGAATRAAPAHDPKHDHQHDHQH